MSGSVVQHSHALPFPAFEKMALAGDLARRGAEKSPHTIKPRHTSLRPAGGRAEHVPTPERLEVKDTFERTWSCQRDGLPFDMGTFEHVEAIHKVASGRLRVTDTLAFHSNRSHVSRTYDVAADGEGIRRESRPWEFVLSAFRGWRGNLKARLVAHHMQPELTQADERLTEILDEAAHARAGRRHAA